MNNLGIDVYSVDILMRYLVGHDRRPSAFVLYLYLWRTTPGRGDPKTQIALVDIAQDVGVSKRSDDF